MVPLQPLQNFKFRQFFLEDESNGTIVGPSNQTPDIVPTSFEPPFEVDLWISVEENKKK
jgi:hypothetical protein